MARPRHLCWSVALCFSLPPPPQTCTCRDLRWAPILVVCGFRWHRVLVLLHHEDGEKVRRLRGSEPRARQACGSSKGSGGPSTCQASKFGAQHQQHSPSTCTNHTRDQNQRRRGVEAPESVKGTETSEVVSYNAVFVQGAACTLF